MEKPISRCPECGMSFQCGVAESGAGAPCWCMQLPALPMKAGMKGSGKAGSAGCFCPACLQRQIEGAIEAEASEEVKKRQ